MTQFGFILLACLCMSFSLNACEKSNWESHWIKGLESISQKNYDSAEFELNLCISELEKNNNSNHMEIYLERAKILNIKKEYTKALVDLNKVLSSDSLKGEARFSALRNRMLANMSLEQMDEYRKDAIIHEETNPFLPKVTLTDTHFIISNLMDAQETKEKIKEIWLKMGWCDTEEDITFYKDGTCFIKRSQCGCESRELDQNEPCKPCFLGVIRQKLIVGEFLTEEILKTLTRLFHKDLQYAIQGMLKNV